MNLIPQLSLDFRVWDDTEPVVFESTRSAGPPDALGNVPDAGVQTSVPVAKRMDMTSRELAASAGAYQSGDVTWLIPNVFLPNGAEEGDVIAAGESERWNVLETNFVTEDQVWELKARNPAIAYNLRDVVNIERPDISYDAANAAVMLFPTGPAPNGGKVLYANVTCRVQPTESDVVDERGVRGTQEKFRIFLSRQVEVTQYDRVNWAGTILDILTTQNEQRIDELPYIDVVKKV